MRHRVRDSIGRYKAADDAGVPPAEMSCGRCGLAQPFEDFPKEAPSKKGRWGKRYYCKRCKRREKHRARRVIGSRAYFAHLAGNCRARSRRDGVVCDIDTDYLAGLWCETCPVLGLRLTIGDHGIDSNAQLDRVVPGLGYVRGNLAFISARANRMKSNGTAAELRSIADYMDKHAQSK